MAYDHGAAGGGGKSSGRKRRIAIIGAGPGGMCTAIKLQKAGYTDFTIFEKAAGVGGTWYVNRYPGLACDVPSHLYSFSFDINPEWSRAYAPQPEILNYMQRLADKFDLMPHIRLSTEVKEAHWDDERSEWNLVLGNGETVTFDIVVSAQGMFNLLNWPNIPGMDSFKGNLFHSARWDEEYDFRGKTVAVIGSAASAVQFVPRIAEVVDRLDLYQRSPNWILPKNDPIFDEDTLEQRRIDPMASHMIRADLYREMEAFCDWTHITDTEDLRQLCLDNISVVKDPELREKLTPTFPWGCTRPLFSNEYYPTFNRDNVDLICDGIERITPDGVVDRTGKERPVDVIICATGYAVDKFLSAIDVTGRNGLKIADAWKDGAEAYLGITTSGFPNMFMIYGPNTNNGSLLYMLECQAEYIVSCVEQMDKNGILWIDPRADAQREYNENLQEEISKVKIWVGGCHNYYNTDSGKIVTQYPHNMTAYKTLTMVPQWADFEYAYDESVSAKK